MKTVLFSICVIIMVASCNEPEVMDPVKPIDPIDTMDLDPVDTKLIEIQNKCLGDYVGTVTRYEYSSSSGTVYDTLYDQKISLTEFKRFVDYPTILKVTLIRNEIILDTSYFGREYELLSDSAVLNYWDGGFSDTFSKITLKQADSSLTTYYSYGHIYGGKVINGYYKRQ